MSAKAAASGGLEPGSPGVGREGAGTGRRESIRQSCPARCGLFTAPRGMLEGTLPGIGQGRAVPKVAQRGFKELQLDPRLGPSPLAQPRCALLHLPIQGCSGGAGAWSQRRQSKLPPGLR